MIFAKIDVIFPRHYRLLEVRPDSVRIPLGLAAGVRTESDRTHDSASVRTPGEASAGSHAEATACIARAAALGVWTAALCYSREHMLDGFCPLSALRGIAVDAVVEELVAQGLLARAERDGWPGVIICNYAKHNETKVDIARRLKTDRARKASDRIPRGHGKSVRSDSDRNTSPPDDRIPPSESESESESEPESESELNTPPSQAPAAGPKRADPSGEHQQLVGHFAAQFERLKGVKPVIGAKGGAGAKKLLQGRTLAEAKAIVDRALADPWMLDRTPDLAAIAARINAFIGRRAAPAAGPQGLLQPAAGSWKKADGAQ
jgi:hypothetical protein